ncbi:hypothetical protein Lbir_0976 [Legionella birminghamensis]|uniref:Protein of uncharacterized function (DUF1625) n=1 Tax=Legionella birminghamensis TaxID=28083 RepID=A0A378I6R3_9GAMM|nr:TMEM43 family protein [Legionella birminghamensis]KTC73920.1 hypothetical protein Lbir_0976 [Legionella birminghamensis]STX30436.1 Protein of uncharacterised function (DUF1625) [Legionella birminghamensis]
MVQDLPAQSWGSRLKDTLACLAGGFVCLGLASYLIFWNEKTGYRYDSSLEQTESLVIAVPDKPVNNDNNQSVVYLTGEALTNRSLSDLQLNITVSALALKRQVLVYEWLEEIDNDKAKPHYHYYTGWREKLIPSSSFLDPNSHPNPASLPIESLYQYAEDAALGDFVLPSTVIDAIPDAAKVDLSKVDLQSLQTKTGKQAALVGNEIYLGANPKAPQVGDLRIRVTAVFPQKISIIAQQNGNTLQAYQAPAGDSILLVASGEVSQHSLVDDARERSPAVVWFVRFICVLLCITGVSLLMRIMMVFADKIKLAHKVTRPGASLVSSIAGLSLWCLITAIALAPLQTMMPIILLAFAIAGVYLLTRLHFKV